MNIKLLIINTNTTKTLPKNLLFSVVLCCSAVVMLLCCFQKITPTTF